MWCDYDEMEHEWIHSTATDATNKPSLLASSYIYRKALIRKVSSARALGLAPPSKITLTRSRLLPVPVLSFSLSTRYRPFQNFLHSTTHEYLAKDHHRKTLRSQNSGLPLEPESVLVQAIPKGCVIELQFADELDELFADELYGILQEMEEAEAAGTKRFWLSKPAMSDKGQGIRLFSTREELEEIFEGMESDDEEEDEESRREDEVEDEEAAVAEEEEEEDDDDAGVQTSQLRHFVIQVRPSHRSSPYRTTRRD